MLVVCDYPRYSVVSVHVQWPYCIFIVTLVDTSRCCLRTSRGIRWRSDRCRSWRISCWPIGCMAEIGLWTSSAPSCSVLWEREICELQTYIESFLPLAMLYSVHVCRAEPFLAFLGFPNPGHLHKDQLLFCPIVGTALYLLPTLDNDQCWKIHSSNRGKYGCVLRTTCTPRLGTNLESRWYFLESQYLLRAFVVLHMYCIYCISYGVEAYMGSWIMTLTSWPIPTFSLACADEDLGVPLPICPGLGLMYVI